MGPRSVRLGAALASALGAVLGLGPPPARACDNDREAAPMERERFPDVVSAISGKFVRHSPEWLAWRAQDRAQRLALAIPQEAGPATTRSSPEEVKAQLPLLDDLGVAYDKLGRAPEAIEEGRKALALAPDRYESLANLGTFLVHAGQAEEGLPLLRRALEVKPDGHFGRLRIQIAVVEYLESRREGGRIRLPLLAEEVGGAGGVGFSAFLARTRTPAGTTVMPLTPEERIAAVKTVVGMIFDAGHDDPALLEVLAHAIVDPNLPSGAGRGSHALAARAYLAASLATVPAEVSAAYRARAARVLEGPEGAAPDPKAPTLARVEAVFATERVAAADFVEEVWADEKEWIATSKDPEAAFAARYFAPQVDKVTVRDGAAMRAASRGGYAEDLAGAPDAAAEAAAPSADRIPTGSLSMCCDHPTPGYPVLLVIVLGLLGGAGLVGWSTRHRPAPRRRPLRTHGARRVYRAGSRT